MKRIPELDGLRAVAILCVLADHALGRHYIKAGALGVDLFFVLSGFLITSLLLAEGRVSLSGFYIRRARRILPALVTAVCLALVLGTSSQSALYALAFMGNLPDSMGMLKHTWSLAVEEHFYIAWPLLFVLLPKHRTTVLICVIVGALALRLNTPWDWPQTYRFTPARIDAIAIGCLAALYPIRLPKLASAFCMAGITVFVLFATPEELPWGLTVFAFLCAGLVLSPPAWLAAKPLQWIGTRSYGIYLYHFPIFYCISPFPGPYAIKVAFMLLLTLLAAELSYRTVEAYFRQTIGIGKVGGVKVPV